MSTPLGIAMVGTGAMAHKHSRVLSRHGQARLRVVCSSSRSLDAAREFSRVYGYARATSDWGSVLDDPQVELVILCNPDSLHPDYTVAALAAAKHVLCEKPLGRTGEDFVRIARALEGAPGVLQVGMNCRYREQYSIPRRLIASGELGRLRFLRGTYLHNCVGLARNREKPWWLDHPAGSYFFLHGGGIHFVDLLQWIGGKVESVYARASAFELGAEGYSADTFSISLAFSSGALGELLVSAGAFRPRELGLEAWLAGGAVLGTTVYRRHGGELAAGSEAITVEQPVIDLGLQYEALARAAAGQEPVMNDFLEAWENFCIISAIERSLVDQRPVAVSTVTESGRRFGA